MPVERVKGPNPNNIGNYGDLQSIARNMKSTLCVPGENLSIGLHSCSFLKQYCGYEKFCHNYVHKRNSDHQKFLARQNTYFGKLDSLSRGEKGRRGFSATFISVAHLLLLEQLAEAAKHFYFWSNCLDYFLLNLPLVVIQFHIINFQFKSTQPVVIDLQAHF